MSDLYVANCTTQPMDFQFRLPEKTKVFTLTIQPGAQICALRGGTMQEVEAILKQHAAYGMLDASEVARASGSVKLISSLDKPVDPDVMMVAQEHTFNVVTIAGYERRKVSGIAAFEKANQITEQAQGSAGRLVQMETQVREEVRQGQTASVDQTTLVSPKADSPDARSARAA